MERVGILVFIALIALVVLLAKRRGREPLPWFVYAVCAFPVALLHVLLVPAARAPKPRGKGHDFVIGFFGGFIPTSVYLLGLMLVYGTHEGVRVFGLREHVIGRGIAVVVACMAGGAQLRTRNPAQAAGFLVIGAIYLVSLVIGLVTTY